MTVSSERPLKMATATPQLEKAIYQLQWLTARARQCATWQDPNSALVAVIIWNTSCLFFWTIVIYALPAVPLLWAARTWPKPDGNDKEKMPLANSSNNDASSLETVLDWLVTMEAAIQTILDAFCWSKHPARSRRNFILLMYFYVVWVTAHQIIDTRYILAVVGTLLLTWQSPWLCQLRDSARYPISIFTAMFLGPLQELNVSSLMQRALAYQESVMNNVAGETHFTFVLVENQRSLGQWQSTNLPFDRAPWTDESNQPVPSKTMFELPALCVQPVAKEEDRKASWTWKWIDSEWRLELNSKTDELGWEYGSVMWTMFDRTPKGAISTRRRRWIRRATLERHGETSTAPLPRKPIPNRIEVPPLSSSADHHGLPWSYSSAQSSATVYQDTDAISSSGNHFVDSATSPGQSMFSFREDAGRRDTFGNQRQSQSSVSLSGEPGLARRRTTSVYTGQQNSDTFVSFETSLHSSKSVDRRVSRDSKRPRDAVWKSIVRN
ncbi:integral peroxisomal membrane peroxin-domain-containing protein [Dichotomocladium elegans]|nr:integral peroxisomal membrane peroxin-domain-containing protein [Dichotomocladium elegans]